MTLKKDSILQLKAQICAKTQAYSDPQLKLRLDSSYSNLYKVQNKNESA